MDFSTIHIDEIKAMLGYKGRDCRSVVEWCAKHKIVILGTGRNRRILASDWERVNLQEYIRRAKEMFPDKWQEVLKERNIAPQESEEQLETQNQNRPDDENSKRRIYRYKSRTKYSRDF